MPKISTIKKPEPASKDTLIPTGLIVIADYVERVPERAIELLTYELQRREREKVLLEETKGFLSWHPWSTLRLLLLSGGVAFTVAWSFSLISDFMRLYNETVTRANLQGAAFGNASMDLTKLIPQSAFGFFSGLPEFGTKESVLVALGVIVALAAFKLLFILLNWEKIKVLNISDRALMEEMRYLKGWIAVLKQPSTPVVAKAA
ncbi:MAG: hypothetical protein KIH65_001665 [Candidatus Uhrbacteria bacterium]|nr:hypothetical protein [Candidatus Uhrbacteria bacterium]